MRGFFRLILIPLVAALASPLAAAPPTPTSPAALTFGILPIGGPAESLTAWRPMLEDMSHALRQPVRSISVSTYEGLAQALNEERVDIAFVSGRIALQAVTRDRMQVIAQLTRSDGSHGYNAVLLVRRDSSLHSVADLLRTPGRWRYARGESLSVSGYLVPETQIFASRDLDSDTFFATVAIDNHQNNALAVANSEADVAANNTADMERFAQHFPDQFARLRVLWTSTLIPHAVIVVRRDLDPAVRQAIATFVTGYARSGAHAAAELEKLKRIHDISGFAPAGNDALVPFADIDYRLDRRRALSAQWVSPAAMQARLQKITRDHQQLLQQLRAGKP
ncbi:MAG: phosphate/phosphite/phosphonate ABC transporter substrate-binding protein [Rhodanobacter sp.]